MALVALSFFASCAREGSDVAPGLWVKNSSVKTFPSDTVLVTGTASNYVGISSVAFVCEEWGLEKVYDLSATTPEVFNFDHQLVVPEDATFEAPVLNIVVTDVNGLKTSKDVTINFLADTVLPAAEPVFAEQISVEYDLEAGNGIWKINVELYDRRGLAELILQIPGIELSETIPLTGEKMKYTKDIIFDKAGNYEVSFKVADKADNVLAMNTEVVVMPREDEDPVETWSTMFLFNANESADDYVDGYYKYMDQVYGTDGNVLPYEYQCVFYAPTDDTKLFFAPTQSSSADLLGVSPYVSSKLMNKNGYVLPVKVPGKGYWGVWIDIKNHAYEFWEVNPAEAELKCTEDVWVSGTGFASFADWGSLAEPMTLDGYVYSQNLEVNAGTIQYYFYTANWARVFRASKDRFWWFESASGDCATVITDYSGPVTVSFDTVLPYGTIKKIKE